MNRYWRRYRPTSTLTPLFKANCDDNMLLQIADADYGEGVDECFDWLEAFLQTESIGPSSGQLREIFNLISVSEPDQPGWFPGNEGPRGHWMRLLACTALVLLDAADPGRNFGEGAIHLGEPAERGTAALLAWRFLTPPSVAEERLSLALAILLLAVRSENVSEHRGEWLLQLTAWLEDEETLARNQTHGYMTLERATNSLWFMVETSWPTVIRQILISQERPHPPEADEILRTLGMLLTTD